MVELNGAIVEIPGEYAEASLLDFLREHQGLRAAKYGCGRGLCGACTVHLDGSAVRACITPVSAVEGRKVTTLEGLAAPAGASLHPVQQAWIDEAVPQCGYCQAGQIMSAVALLAERPSPSDAEIVQAMEGNLCRCGTYLRIRRAIRRVAPVRP